MIKIETLSKDDRESLQDFCQAIYLDGECYAFAIALHRLTDMSIVCVMQDDKMARHAGVVDVKGRFFDARGWVTTDMIGAPFSLRSCELRPITEEDLFKMRPISESAIKVAGCMAEKLWPDLPWNRKSLKNKVKDFVEELDELCKKHQLFMRSSFPTAPFIIEEAAGDEGFVVRPLLTGQYSIDRFLSS